MTNSTLSGESSDWDLVQFLSLKPKIKACWDKINIYQNIFSPKTILVKLDVKSPALGRAELGDWWRL